MSNPFRFLLAAALVLGTLGLTAPAAEAHGWKRHHHVRVTHRRVRIRHARGPLLAVSYEPVYGPQLPLFGWGIGCGLQHFITRTGALAYRPSCY